MAKKYPEIHPLTPFNKLEVGSKIFTMFMYGASEVRVNLSFHVDNGELPDQADDHWVYSPLYNVRLDELLEKLADEYMNLKYNGLAHRQGTAKLAVEVAHITLYIEGLYPAEK